MLLRHLIAEAACYLWREFFFFFLACILFAPIAQVLSRIGLRASVPLLVSGALLPPNSCCTFVTSPSSAAHSFAVCGVDLGDAAEA